MPEKRLRQQPRQIPINYLTSEQLEVLNDDKYKHCIIRGPGGSGKTVAMLINVIRLSHRTDKDKLPIVIIAYDKECAENIKKSLDRLQSTTVLPSVLRLQT